MKLSLGDLNPDPPPPYPTSTYTSKMTIVPRVCGGDLMVLGCKKCDCSLVLKNTDLLTIKNTREVNVILVNINGQQCNLFIYFLFIFGIH